MRNRFTALKSSIPVSQSVLSQGFSVGINAQPKDQTPIKTVSKPQYFNAKTGEIHHGDP